MAAKQVARIFGEIGEILAVKGESPFKTRAYENAARTVEGLGSSLEEPVREERYAAAAQLRDRIRDISKRGPGTPD